MTELRATEKRNRLHHVWCEPMDSFLARIDEFGGWPLGRRFVSFCHSDERHCEFGDVFQQTGWWTTVATADDYYRWKLTPAAIAKIKREVRQEMIGELQRGL